MTTSIPASPEDMILRHLWHYQEGRSEKHFHDLAAILQVSGGQLDRQDVDHWAIELSLTEPW